MKIDAGSHNYLFRAGMKLYKASPSLYKAGVSVLTVPDRISAKLQPKPAPNAGGKIKQVNLEVTVICNLRCSMCWWWGEKGIVFDMLKNKDSMVTRQTSTQEIFDVIDQVAKERPGIYLAGGEPFQRGDCIDIIEYAAGKGMSVVTNSNGTLLSDAQLERLSRIKRLTVNFSIDGTREVHDRIRGKGTYDKTLNTIRKLAEYRGDRKYPSFKTNTTFSPWLVGHMDELIKELQETGQDGIRMQHLWFTDEETAARHREALRDAFGIEDNGARTHIISRPTEEYVKKLAAEIIQVGRTKYKMPIMIHPLLSYDEILRYYTDLNFSKMDSCHIADNTMLVKANGDVMFCPDEWMTKFKIGNIRESKVHEMWNNEQAKKFRSELGRRGLFPACKRCCVLSG